MRPVLDRRTPQNRFCSSIANLLSLFVLCMALAELAATRAEADVRLRGLGENETHMIRVPWPQ
jgi:hypothetical protein